MITEFKGEYDRLSSFYPVEVTIHNRVYPTVEQAYQSVKSYRESWKATCSSPRIKPGEIKRASRNLEDIRPDRDRIKLSVMEYLVLQKFKQEPFRSKLLATGDLNIAEGNRRGDDFRGICLKKNKGQNHLGRMIMEVRKTLQAETVKTLRGKKHSGVVIIDDPLPTD